MRIKWCLPLFLIVGLGLSACQNQEPTAGSVASEAASSESSLEQSSVSSQNQNQSQSLSSESQAAEKEESPMRVMMIVNGREHPIRLNDSKAARSFYEQLPLEAELEDYNQTEKIYYPPEKLDTSDAPAGMAAKAGQLNYYAPWGNICFFYEDFPYGNGLVNLGELEEGPDVLTQYGRNFNVSFQPLDK